MNKSTKAARTIVFCCGFGVLAACGGGGSSSGQSANSPSGGSSSSSSISSVSSSSSGNNSTSSSTSSSSAASSSSVSVSSSSSSQSSSVSSSSSLAGSVNRPRYVVVRGTDPNASHGLSIFLIPLDGKAPLSIRKLDDSVLSWGQLADRFYYFRWESDGNIHLYGTLLNDLSAVPTPQRVSSLELAGAGQLCDVNALMDNLGDSNTAKIMIRIAGNDSVCNDADDINELVDLNAPISVAPTVMAFNSKFNMFFPFYSQTGSFMGVMFNDVDTSTFSVAKQANFAEVLPLVTHDANVPITTVFSNWDYAPMLLSASVNGMTKLFRTSINGGSEPIYDAKGIFNMVRGDTDAVYFTDYHWNPNTYDIYEAPFTMTGQPILLYSEQGSNVTRYGILGSSASKLILYNYDSTKDESYFYTIPKGTHSNGLTLIRTYSGKEIDFFVSLLGASDTSQPGIVGVRWDKTVGNTGYVTDIFDTNGNSIIASLRKTVVARTSSGSTRLIAFGDIKDVDGNYGGSTVNDIDLSTAALTPYKSESSSDFRVGSGQRIMFDNETQEYGIAKLGSPSSSNEYIFDFNKPITTLIFDFRSRMIYVAPTSINGTALSYY